MEDNYDGSTRETKNATTDEGKIWGGVIFTVGRHWPRAARERLVKKFRKVGAKWWKTRASDSQHNRNEKIYEKVHQDRTAVKKGTLENVMKDM